MLLICIAVSTAIRCLLSENFMMMKEIYRIWTLFLLMTVAAVAQSARVYDVKDVPSPNVANRDSYVFDPEGVLSSSALRDINSRLGQLRSSTTAEVGVAVLPSIGDRTVDDFAPDLMKSWGLGKKDKNNGLLLLIVMDQRKARIETGYGLEGVVTDMDAASILRHKLFPLMADGDVDEAVEGTVATLSDMLSDPEAADEIRSSLADDEDDLDPQALLEAVLWIAGLVTLATAIWFTVQCMRDRRRDRYHRALTWRSEMWIYWAAAVLSLGGALVFALLALWRSRRARNKPLKCKCCGTTMHKLSEEEDNLRLTPAEDLEERLNTVDYDVWECDRCGAIDKYAFPMRQTRYSRCPRCGTVAMRLIHDYTKVPATTRRPGVGERVYECKYCSHQKHDQYTIPRRDNGAGAAAALGAASIIGGSRGSSGGYSGGGGFGGGFSGGGGASGGW